MTLFVNTYQKTKHFVKKYERHLSSVALVLGYIIDNLTLTRVDYWFDHAIILTHLIIVALGILALNAIEMKETRGKYSGFFYGFLPILMQFSFGALFSAFSVLYARSASITVSGAFILIILVFLIGNEFLKEKYRILTLQISFLTLVTYLYFILLVPLAFAKVSNTIFIVSGVATLVIVYGFIRLVRQLAPARFNNSRLGIAVGVVVVFVVVNSLYFYHIIPPIPLALKDVGVYHSVVHVGGNYFAEAEAKPWYDFLNPYKNINLTAGQPVFVYTSIYSPARFEMTVTHKWQYYNETTENWQTTDSIAFKTVGGSATGYRGYTEKTAVVPGLWRVSVETEDDAVIGRILFNIYRATTTPALESKVL